MINEKTKLLYSILRISMSSLDTAIHQCDTRRIRIEFDHLHNLHEYIIENNKNGTRLYLNVDAKIYAQRMDEEYPGWRDADVIGKTLPSLWELLKSKPEET